MDVRRLEWDTSRMRTLWLALGLSAVIVASTTGCSAVVEAPPAPSEVVSPTPTEAVDVSSQINGLYQVTITEDELAAGGVTDESLIAEYAGLYYWTFENGRWIYDQTSERPLENPGGVGEYSIDGTRYTHYWGDKPTEITTATITILADGSLQFTDIVDGDPALQQVSEVTFGLHPWVRIGD